MLSKESIKKVCDFMLCMARNEKKIEILREKLSELEAFEPYATFRRIDRSGKNTIDANDIRLYLKDNSIYFDEETIAATFLQHYDYDSDGVLCYAEYLRALLPNNQPGLRTLVTQRPTYHVNEDELLEKNVESSLAKLLNAEISSYIDLEPQKKEIFSLEDFSADDLYQMIDIERYDYIDFKNLNEFFKNNDFYPYEEEIISILRRLDKNDDGRLTLKEIKMGLKPKDFSSMVPKDNFVSIEKYYNRSIKKVSSPYQSSYKSPLISRKFEEENSHKKYGVASKIKEDNKPNSNVKTPPQYAYLPFEPVRRAFSPLKDQMLKSGGDPEKYEKSFEKTYKSKYEETNRNSPYRNKINNDYNGRNAKSDVIMYFKRVIQYENDLEKYKQELYFRPDFNIFDLFNFLDKDNKGYCSINDLENAFVAMNIEISSKGNWLFFKKTEKNNSGKIKFSEFSKNFIPILLDSPNQNDRRSINTDRRFDYSDLFSLETRRLISNLIRTHVEYEIALENQRELLIYKLKTKIDEIFEDIDLDHDGLLEFYELKSLLEKEGDYTAKDITLLNEKISSSLNGKISYEDFKNELKPHLN